MNDNQRLARMFAELLDIDLEDWKGNCHGIASEIIAEDMLHGSVTRGLWLGPIAEGSHFRQRPLTGHSWITPRDGWFEYDGVRFIGDIVDPTRWVFENVEPYIYVGPNDHYDVGGNIIRASMLGSAPVPAKGEKRKVYKLNPCIKADLAIHLGDDAAYQNDGLAVTIAQSFWLLNHPLDGLQPHAKEIYEAAIEAGDGAIIPFDNRRTVTDK